MPDASTQREVDKKPLNLLRTAYPKEEKKGAVDIANTVYNLYKNGDIEFAKEIARYLTRLDWRNKKHDMIYRVENGMKAIGDEGFKTFIESIKRERRGKLPMDIGGEVAVAYKDRSKNSIRITVSLWGKILAERLDEPDNWRVHSHADSDKWYSVRLGQKPECTCEDFVYRKNKVGGKCKHIYEVEAVKAVLNIAST
jgi:hypothetical protein